MGEQPESVARRDGEPFVPARCVRAPNAAFDRGFGLYVCNQRDARCAFHGPVYVLSEENGRRYECRKKALSGGTGAR